MNILRRKKNIYFVQMGFSFGKALYLPYAVGCLASYAEQSGLGEDYSLRNFFYKRENPETVLSKISEPYMVCFSSCVWNTEYNKALAKLIKTEYPDCLIVFGGHNVADNTDMIDECEAVDFLIYAEGEVPFAALLGALRDGTQLDEVPSLAYRKNGAVVRTPVLYGQPLTDFPSPYLSGMFDKLIERGEDTEFLSVLETNRGCPYNCAYCDWCEDDKLRRFPLEKIKAEIDWIASKKIEYCFCADSNFGIFERDEDIVKYLVASKEKCGYPDVFRPCYAKNSDDRVFRICSSLDSHGMDKGATLAYQTLSKEALFNIHRQNMSMERYSGLLERYNRAGIATYSELILGLPGETYQSFAKGLCTLVEAGQHNSVSVYHCEMLPNSEMANPDYIKKFGIKTIKVAFNHMHSSPESGESVREYSHLIVETATMSRGDWIKSNLFSICIQCFHHLGLLRCFAIYLYYEKNYSYYQFYNSLLRFITESGNTISGGLFRTFEDKFTHSLAGDWNYYDDKFGDVVWLFEEGAFLELLYSGDKFWDEIMPFLKSLPIEEEVFDELLAYQKTITRKPGDKYIELTLDYDFYNYFKRIYSCEYRKPEKRKNSLLIENAEFFSDWKTYAKECVWYGRRLGRTQYTSDRSGVSVHYLQED